VVTLAANHLLALEQPYYFVLPGKSCANFYYYTPNMSRIGDHGDPRVKKTLQYMEANPNLTLPAAMRAADSLLKKKASVQMLVRRRLPSKPLMQITVAAPTATSASTVSTLTTTPVASRGKVKQVRHTSKATQQTKYSMPLKERRVIAKIHSCLSRRM